MNSTINVHVRVNDADTGLPTPVRLRIATSDDAYLAPLGRPIDFPIGRNEEVGGHVYLDRKRYCYIDGTCEIPLPTGLPLSIEICKGPLYELIRQTVTLAAGQMALRFVIQRYPFGELANCNQVDARSHFLSPHSAQLEAAAEGLDLANLLVTVQDYRSHDGHLYRVIPNSTAFSGQTAAISNVYVNTLNCHPTLGRLALLNCHRAVYPLTFGGYGETDDWSLADWSQQCHRKKGLVIWCDAYRKETGLPGGEALVQAILGRIDAIEFDAFERSTPFLPMWYRLLNAGYRLPIVGGSGKDSNRQAIGSARTLTPACQNPETRYGDWVEHVRAGRTVCSNGPMLRLTIDDQPFCTAINHDVARPMKLCAEVAAAMPFESLELVANGHTIGQAAPSHDGYWSAKLEIEHTLPQGGWLAARCWGATRSELYPHGPVFAHTTPTVVAVPGLPAFRDPTAFVPLRRDIERVRDWVESEGQFNHPKRKEALLNYCAEALERLVP